MFNYISDKIKFNEPSYVKLILLKILLKYKNKYHGCTEIFLLLSLSNCERLFINIFKTVLELLHTMFHIGCG